MKGRANECSEIIRYDVINGRREVVTLRQPVPKKVPDPNKIPVDNLFDACRILGLGQVSTTKAIDFLTDYIREEPVILPMNGRARRGMLAAAIYLGALITENHIGNTRIAAVLGVSANTSLAWRKRMKEILHLDFDF